LTVSVPAFSANSLGAVVATVSTVVAGTGSVTEVTCCAERKRLTSAVDSQVAAATARTIAMVRLADILTDDLPASHTQRV
jgi:hypothetical protein